MPRFFILGRGFWYKASSPRGELSSVVPVEIRQTRCKVLFMSEGPEDQKPAGDNLESLLPIDEHI